MGPDLAVRTDFDMFFDDHTRTDAGAFTDPSVGMDMGRGMNAHR
jgi:hypothetical protein